uniref:C2H2-type domain-containing protein n=1 Tax=Fagus sylvatica TaxID=28930 RepID=A0A2N9GWC4_FAGSY
MEHKCSACYKQYKKKEHLVEHMKVSYHSVHQPKCGVCQKHCKSFESLREHIFGPMPKENCSRVFSEQGCDICLKVFDSPSSLSEHKKSCRISAPNPIDTMKLPYSDPTVVNHNGGGPEAIGIDCEMVGGGDDGSLDLCVRVCLIDEDENVIFHTYVHPQIPITNFRYEITGLTEDHLKDALPLKLVQEKILQILYNGESIVRARLHGGKARLLVGHGLEHDLDCLRMTYPDHLLRYNIQTGFHDPYEDCVSAMRLYKRMRAQDHQIEASEISTAPYKSQNVTSKFDSLRAKELEQMSPDELYEISRPNYRCWCLDSSQAMQP